MCRSQIITFVLHFRHLYEKCNTGNALKNFCSIKAISAHCLKSLVYTNAVDYCELKLFMWNKQLGTSVKVLGERRQKMSADFTKQPQMWHQHSPHTFFTLSSSLHTAFFFFDHAVQYHLIQAKFRGPDIVGTVTSVNLVCRLTCLWSNEVMVVPINSRLHFF